MEDSMIVNVSYLDNTPFITTLDHNKKLQVKLRLEIRSLTEFSRFQLKSVSFSRTTQQFYKIESDLLRTKNRIYSNDRFPTIEGLKMDKVYDDPGIIVDPMDPTTAKNTNPNQQNNNSSTIPGIDFGIGSGTSGKIVDSKMAEEDDQGWLIGVDMTVMRVIELDTTVGDHFMKYQADAKGNTTCTIETTNVLVVNVEYVVDKHKMKYFNKRYSFRLPIILVDAMKVDSRELKLTEDLNNDLRMEILWTELVLQDNDNDVRLRFISNYSNTWKLNNITLKLMKIIKFKTIGEPNKLVELMNISKHYNNLVLNSNLNLKLSFNLSDVLMNQLTNVKVQPSSNQESKLMIDTIIQERSNNFTECTFNSHNVRNSMYSIDYELVMDCLFQQNNKDKLIEKKLRLPIKLSPFTISQDEKLCSQLANDQTRPDRFQPGLVFYQTKPGCVGGNTFPVL